MSTDTQRRLQVFSCNSNPELAREIAEHVGVPLGNAVVGSFSDGEIHVRLDESVRGSDVYVIQSTCHPVNQNLMELLVMVDALKRASARTINVVIPYYGYARQDRKTRARDPITAKLVANLIETAGAGPDDHHGSACHPNPGFFRYSCGPLVGRADPRGIFHSEKIG